VCLALVEVCLGNLERHIADSGREIEKFSKRYNKMFEAFDRGIKENRERYRNGQVTLRGDDGDATLKPHFIPNGLDGSPPLEGSSNDEKSLSNKENRDAENQQVPKKAPEPVKSVKKANLRRRRRRFNDSEYESDEDSNSRSDEEEGSDSSDSLSCFESSEGEDSEEEGSDDEVYDPVLAPDADSDDIVVEEETIIYHSGVQTLMEKLKIRPTGSSADDLVIEEETLIYPEGGKEPAMEAASLKYRKQYEKINPNVVIEFVQTERTLRALKVIFDWLRLTPDILVACYVSNPEFIHKIMRLINICNIDIFTRKVYFERSMVTGAGLRQELVELFDTREKIPTAEDVLLKGCALFAEHQMKLDWEASQRLQVSGAEDNLLRMLKFVDFGFYLTKMRKFNYSFCTKTRNFVENPKKGNQGGQRQRRGRTVENGRGGEKGAVRQPRRRKNRRRNERRLENGDGRMSPPAQPPPAIQQRKGYLKNKSQANGYGEVPNRIAIAGGSAGNSNASSERESNDETKQQEKNELICQLWLRNEVKTLESKVGGRICV
jgi:protein SMG5